MSELQIIESTLSVLKFVGDDITPDLTDDQVKLIRLQTEDAQTRRQTRRGTEGVYAGLIPKQKVPISRAEDALPPRSLEQAQAAAAFLARNGKPFYVVPDTRREGGFVAVPETKAKPYLENNQTVSLHGTPTPPKTKAERPARASRRPVQPPAPDPAAIMPAPDPAPLTFVPPDPVPAREIKAEAKVKAEVNPYTGDLMHNADKPALADYCRLQMTGGGWNEDATNLVLAAVAQEIIQDSAAFGDVVFTAKAVQYVDEMAGGCTADLTAFAEAIMYQAKGGMSAYLEALQAETAELTELNKSVGGEAPTGLILANIAAGRRIIAVQAGIGQELPPPEAKPKRSRKKKADTKADTTPAPDPAPEVFGPLACARCRVAACVDGPGNLCDKCEAVLTNKEPEIVATPEVLEAIEESPVADPPPADPLAYLSDMSEPDPFE